MSFLESKFNRNYESGLGLISIILNTALFLVYELWFLKKSKNWPEKKRRNYNWLFLGIFILLFILYTIILVSKRIISPFMLYLIYIIIYIIITYGKN